MKALAYLALAGGVLLAACSPISPKSNADGGDTPDANTIDGGGDTPDAGPGPATARALDVDGNPLAGVNVAFSEPDGTLISMATTPASGEVSETVPMDAIISFGYSTLEDKGTTGRYMVQVIHAVQPGDTVEAILGGVFDSTSELLGQSTLMFPTLHAGANSYSVGTECDNFWPAVQQTATKDFYSDRCIGRNRTTLDLLGIAWSNSNSPLAWTMFDDVEIGAANTFTSSGWNTNFAQFNAFYTNAPYDGTIELRVGLIRDGIDYAFGGFNGDFAVTSGGNAAYVVPVPAAFTQVLHVGAQLFNPARDRLILHQTNLMPTTTSNSVDLDGLGFPGISSVTLDTAMPGRPAYRWSADGTIPAAADAVIALTLWGDPTGQWMVAVLAPSDTTSPLRLPALPNTFLADPTNLSPRWPPPAAPPPFQNVVGLYESGDHADYEAMRQQRGLAGLLGEAQFLSPTAPIGSRSVLSVGGLFSN